MKKSNFLIPLFLTLFTVFLYKPVCAYTTLEDGVSMWVHLGSGIVPEEIDSFALFWPLIGNDGDPIPDSFTYNVYAPVGWSDAQYFDPYTVDLSPFQGKDIIFEIITEGKDLIFHDYAYIWGEVDNEDEEYDVIGGHSEAFMLDAQFYFAFYEYADSEGTRQAISYLPGAASSSAPAHGDLFYSSTILGSDVAAYFHSQSFPFSIAQRSDFSEPVPEPMTILLLGSGLAGLAGIRKRLR